VSPLVPRRPDLAAMTGYHSPQVDVDVRLNTNESPYPPPEGWREELVAAVEAIDFHRYPDRGVRALREALAERHGVGPDEVFCANGSDEVLQCLLLAFGGPGRRAAVFEPTYRLHSHIARVTGTEVVTGGRTADFRVDPAEADRLLAEARPVITFLCSPNNPTGRSDPPELVRHLASTAPGLVVVDEAYGQFAPWSALSLRAERGPARRTSRPDVAGLVVVRTFSKTWAMAAVRLGYLVADPEVVAGCEAVVLPYHLSAVTQAAGLLALDHQAAMEARVAQVAEERGRLAAALAELPVTAWPSDANFILFRPERRDAAAVWQDLADRGVLVRDCSGWEGLAGCLRVTVGTAVENDRFLAALREVVA
jgi:histidinol-phosphate aminotransferase